MATICSKYRRAVIFNLTGPAPFGGDSYPVVVTKKDGEPASKFRLRVASMVLNLKMSPAASRDLFEVRYEY